MPPDTLTLGRVAATAAPLQLPSRSLTTHGVVLGMTGSGKTGLSIGLLEEAARAGVPVIAIDPKGDLGNLALAFPSLSADDFAPWIDPEEARRAGKAPEAHAADVAGRWRAGLADWGMGPAEVRQLRDANEVRIYTPGSRAGVPLAMLRSLAAPVNADEDTLREQVVSATSALLGLVGVAGDGMQSREHVLVSRLLHDAWEEGHSVDLGWLIAAIQRPPFDRIGVLALDDFFPAKERTALAMQLNNLLAAPGTAAWMEGEPLDIASMLYGPGGRPRTCVISIAHLGDAERMFAVTALLDALVAWMRAQPGTSSLRALLFMDEVFGYLPPTANPPSKTPMLTLLKQARAFGLGVVLATQNPVDLDYKALSNCGTWFLGRLQTDRDRQRVLDGLEGAATAGFDRGTMDRVLMGLQPRHFVLHSVHGSGPQVFQSRWTMSYLRGPVTREEIKRLKAPSVARAPSGVSHGVTHASTHVSTHASGAAAKAAPPGVSAPAIRPALPSGTEERFLGEGTLAARAYVQARLHYVDKRGVDVWEDVCLAAPLLDDDVRVDWDAAETIEGADVTTQPPHGAQWDAPPAWLKKAGAKDFGKRFSAWVQQGRTMVVLVAPDVGLVSAPGEPESAFRDRAAAGSNAARTAAVQAIRARYATRVASAQSKVAKAEAKVDKEAAEAQTANIDTVATWGGALLGAMFGRGSAVSKVTSAARTTNRNMARHQDVAVAKEALEQAQAALAELSAAMETEIARSEASFDPTGLVIEQLEVRPRKADTQVLVAGVVWCEG